ncbi:hypothetical protein ACFSGX_05215 [Sphingomonas arantia]|uniref:Type II secretion system protein GspE N-terminal domain-containing protein n=1 Tax=Sphingomonas arantia TaxID=1460676 RepID=A0ABW4TXN1_9SPHN
MSRLPPPTPADLGDIDPAFLRAHGIVPVAVTDGRLVVTMPDPEDQALIATLAFAARRPVVAQAAEVEVAAPVARPAPSLAAGLFGAIGGDRSGDWLAVEMVAQLVADGVELEPAVARVRALHPERAELLDRIVAGALPAGWDEVGGASADLPAVAAAMRCELECGAALRQAVALVALVAIVAVVTVGMWSLALLPAVLPMRGAVVAWSGARRDGRALAVGTDVASVTPAERDRVAAGGAVVPVIAAVQDRALLTIRDAGGRAAVAMLLVLAVLVVVRLG